jgi:hypothetical protein
VEKNAVRSEASPSITPRASNVRPPDPSPSPAPTISDSADPELRDEIVGEIDGWRETTEEMDLDTLMAHYAPRVDYYNKRGAAVDYIRGDKSRAFSRFETIQMKLSDIQVTQNAAGDKVTAVFDKTWRFQGARTSTGKVREQLELSRINGRWLITAERDLKVY